MALTGILSGLTDWIASFTHSFSDSSPTAVKPEPALRTDQYAQINRGELLRDAFGQTAAPSSAWGKESPLQYSPWVLFSIAGCGNEGLDYQGGSGGSGSKKDAGVDAGGGAAGDGGSGGKMDAGKPDAGPTTPVDKDGDGFKSDIDCNDSDPNTFPLKDDQVLNVTKSLTICPGTYKRVRINLNGVSGISVKGTGVILDADGAKVKDAGVTTGIVHFNNAHNVDFSGFHIKNYADWYAAIRMDGSNSNKLHDLTISGLFEVYGGLLGAVVSGIWALNSSNNTILDTDISGKGASIYFQNGSANYVGSCNIDFTPKSSGTLDAAVMFASSLNGTVENCIFKGAGVFIANGSNGATVKTTSISDAPAGVWAGGNSAQLLNNIIHYSLVGADLYGDSLTLTGNDLRYNNQCYKADSGSTGNTISGNQCN